MKLFTIGPVEMYPSTLEIKRQPVPYFRNQNFSDLLEKVDKKFKNIIGTNDSSKTIYLTASGTAGLEASVINCFTNEDKLIVVNGGSFGRRFSQICDIHDIPHCDIELVFGEVLSQKHLDKFNHKGYTGLLVNLDETSTGQLYDINMISMFCKKNNIVLVVDAITSFLCDPFDMDKMGIDVAIVSSQKGLCMSPGLACIELTDKVIKERVNKINCKSLYFNFKDYLQNLERFQTPFTPAISLIYEMDDILNKILETGKKEWLQHIRENAEYFRKEVVKFDCCSIPEYPISYAITPVLFNKPIAKELKERLAADYDIYINPCGGEIADTMIRISHIGNLGIPDYKELLEDMKEVIKDLSL